MNSSLNTLEAKRAEKCDRMAWLKFRVSQCEREAEQYMRGSAKWDYWQMKAEQYCIELDELRATRTLIPL